MPMSGSATQNNSNGVINVAKRAPLKDNKQFPCKNLSSAFANVNGHQNAYGGQQNNVNWQQPPPTTNIWSSSSTYSDVVAKPPLDVVVSNNSAKMNQNFGMMNGMVNGGGGAQPHRGYQQPEQPLMRMNSNFSYVEHEEGSQYGPIGTKKSPSSTPSWEPLAAGMNHHGQLHKPMPFTNQFFPQSPNPTAYMQQSKLMNLMSHSEKNAQMQQQQQQQQIYDEQYLLKLQFLKMQMQERKQAEWLNQPATTTSNNLWSPAYRRESPTAPTSNWSSPSPPLPPPGFEQQFQPATNAQQNHQNPGTPVAQVIPAYDPFKSLSAIWEPNRNDNNNAERDSWNQ